MQEKIIIAGAGGQGIMLLGKVLAAAAMRENKYITWLPSYGAEVRGGTAHCMVIISTTPIGSPYIDRADTLIVMNRPSLTRFSQRIKNQGLLIINSSLAHRSTNNNLDTLKHPFTDIAIKLGNIKVANIVALGCFIAKSNIVSAESIIRVITDMAPSDKRGLIGINKRALREGMDLR